MCEKCIDKRIAMLYNNKRYNLIKSGGGIWSYEARQPVFKVLNPAVYPKDEDFKKIKASFVKKTPLIYLCSFKTEVFLNG